MKNLICSSPADSEEDLTARIIEVATTIRQKPGIFERTRQTLLRHCQFCIEVSDHTFEHLL
jgi:hypothetical protein